MFVEKLINAKLDGFKLYCTSYAEDLDKRYEELKDHTEFDTVSLRMMIDEIYRFVLQLSTNNKNGFNIIHVKPNDPSIPIFLYSSDDYVCQFIIFPNTNVFNLVISNIVFIKYDIINDVEVHDYLEVYDALDTDDSYESTHNHFYTKGLQHYYPILPAHK